MCIIKAEYAKIRNYGQACITTQKNISAIAFNEYDS